LHRARRQDSLWQAKAVGGNPSPTDVQHDAMNVIFEVVLPVFGLIITGYLAGRFRVLGGDAASAINRLVFYFALPALLFTFAARAHVAESLNWPFIGAFPGGTLVTSACAFAVSRVSFRNDTVASIRHAHAAVFANTVYLDIPLSLLAFGEQGAMPMIASALCLLVVISGVIASVDVRLIIDKNSL
jgi:hypothetical protein